MNVNHFTLDYPLFTVLNETEIELVCESKYLSDYRKGGEMIFLRFFRNFRKFSIFINFQ